MSQAKVEEARQTIVALAQNMKNLSETVGDDVDLLLITEQGAGPVPLRDWFRECWLALNTISTDLLLAFPVGSQDQSSGEGS